MGQAASIPSFSVAGKESVISGAIIPVSGGGH